ncbi:acetyl/propionyl-CoA carboxylase alpha subunit [Bradyrhizobium japonicum]
MDRSMLYRRFRTLLIANRGEIACRVIRTARAMGLRTVAVYSEADRDAMHVALADEAVLLGPARARDSYLSVERLIEAARKTGAEAVHPGYGFLSENAEFARACLEAGLVFVGPTAAMMTAMGSKSGSKALMEKAGVPLVPGYHGEAQDDATLSKAADKIGFPILVKASAGGGGRGMRIVRSADELGPAIVSAKREAKAAFGDDRMLIEKYVDNPRHIEVQIIGDSHGNLLSLFERECTLQRRHQKVIEEAPSPTLNPAQRETVCAAARKAAGAVNYVGAGTIEFVSDGKDVFFIEMNTRLQVEHPVTELITGIDLVEWQLRVAFGEALPLKQDEIKLNGHAVEARVYAENPTKNFMPSVGRISTWRLPAETGGLRIDAGYREGDTVSPYYDAMLAKMDRMGADAGRRDRAAEPRAARLRRPRHRDQHPVPVGADDASEGADQCDRYRLHRARAGGPDAGRAGARRARALRGSRRDRQRRAAGRARRGEFALADLWLDAGRPPPAQLCLPRRPWT